VKAAPSGLSGPWPSLTLATQQPLDVILLDIHLPGMDGYDVLQALQADNRTRAIPVIALSADAMPEQVERGLQVGFQAYQAKPLDALADPAVALQLQRALPHSRSQNVQPFTGNQAGKL
jgi:CheY-like chemotaxis protein